MDQDTRCVCFGNLAMQSKEAQFELILQAADVTSVESRLTSLLPITCHASSVHGLTVTTIFVENVVSKMEA